MNGMTRDTYTERLFRNGERHLSAGRSRGAERCFRAALRRAPEFAEAHANLGLILDSEGKQDEAEEQYRQALALAPELARTRMNLGVLLTNRKRFAEAEDSFRRALELTPASPAVWSNLGVLLACLKREEEAEACYRQALTLAPDFRRAQFNLSYLLLRQGRFAEGWRCLEARDAHLRLEQIIPFPRWRGESLAGRSLVIGFDGGYGDMIHYCRYAPTLKAEGAAYIAVICHPPLKTILATIPGVDAVFAYDDPSPLEPYDFWSMPESLPLYCRTDVDSIPAPLPYLRADPDLAACWASELAVRSLSSTLRVGLVWKGNPLHENDGERSLPGLQTLETLGSVPGIFFFSLQKGEGAEEADAPPSGFPLVDLAPRIADFADTAAIVMNLDLVICVDTAVAHLAGALGKTCWVLLPHYKPDWRWLAGRDDSPWYPGVMRLFHQRQGGDWSEAVSEVREELRKLVDQQSHFPIQNELKI